MNRRSVSLLRAACGLTLAALALLVWGIVHPRPVPVIVAMSLGQAIGTLAVVLFGVVVLRDLRPVLGGKGPSSPADATPEGAPQRDVDEAESVAPPAAAKPPGDDEPPGDGQSGAPDELRAGRSPRPR